MKDTEIYKNLIEVIDETVSVRVHHFQINYQEMIQRALAKDNSAICGVAHCLYWGKGGPKNREYAKFILRKLIVEKANITAEYLMAHYTIIDGDNDKGFSHLKKLDDQGFLPARTLYYYLGYKNERRNVPLSLVREKLFECAESGHMKAWLLIMQFAKNYRFPKRVWKSIYYSFRFASSGFLKYTKDLKNSEKAFLFD